MHGGRIEAESPGAGQGTTFTVRLPAGAAAQAQPPKADQSAGVGRLRRRVLVVDDNRDSVTSLSLLLAAMGSEVCEAHDGFEAVERVADFRPDVVLLDIGMPRLNGYDAARRIRRLAGGRQVVLVALTGWGHEEDRRRSREAGFDVHLTKPVQMEDLRALLEQLARDREASAHPA
jgi:CheY-like chemotaxis protein